MNNIKKAMQHLKKSAAELEKRAPISFDQFLKMVTAKPDAVLRNIFQIFYDMVKTYVEEEMDEYPDDPESINYVKYDCTRLFIEGSDHPFFADRLFANRLINHVKALQHGAQQNKIYIFDGPHGSGKSTFLNNLLRKFEEYTNTEKGMRYEVVWRINQDIIDRKTGDETISILERLVQLQESQTDQQFKAIQNKTSHFNSGYIEVSCPCHDHPILMVPKSSRRAFLDELFGNEEFKRQLFTAKEYEWVFKDIPCTICSSIYEALLSELKDPEKVFSMIYARPYGFNRRLGKGISVFNPGDRPMKQIVFTNAIMQKQINRLFKDSNQVKYVFSRYSNTNNGIYALMDIKSHNIERLIELHNIISEGVHKVEDVEENINSLFLALMNPEDKKNIQDIQSFSDRIIYINIPYVMDINTEVEIYRNIFGKHIDESFLPRVLHNFARVIISSRMDIKSKALLEWIGDPDKYKLYCDKYLQLLKMEIYTGYIPDWLIEEDRKRLTAKRRRKIIAESKSEGAKGISGRDSIKIFNEFFSIYDKQNKPIDMLMLCKFFNARKNLKESIPDGFLDSLLHMYDYTVLQEVKESLYYYNEEQISKEIQNYIFAVNFEPGTVETCHFTGDLLDISIDFFEGFEKRILGSKSDKIRFLTLRQETQKEYTSKTLTQEIMISGLKLAETKLFNNLHERYVYNLKEKVLGPFLENENFRLAIKTYHTEEFKTHDKKIKNDITFMINNLVSKYHYTPNRAQAVCIYVVDNDLAKQFSLKNL